MCTPGTTLRNILLKLKKDIDNTPYNLVLTDISFYKACKKNIGIINIYEPTNLTPLLLKIIVDESEKIKSQDDLFTKIKYIHENISTEENKEYIQCCTNEIKKKLEHYLKDTKIKIKKAQKSQTFWLNFWVVCVGNVFRTIFL